ncbi:hypothetical protein DdX_05466 [Ditylenchus destructor]|uniref:Rho GTPase-activating protein 29/45 N-terminal domain-containing protein n=1 Tax=Ditylenchus destructor TaxID=166010 RepID=A0AAD4N679_9BILA|nr:hypothetical protein DdX_05466 [Ditylenchus destructor]
MSSSCSSIDLGIDPDFDDSLTESLINDIEAFVEHVNALRNALNTKSTIPDGNTKCVQVHAALSLVSQSVRDLLRYSAFKTSQVLIPASQLVHSVKSITFDTSNFEATRSLLAIERLESAIGNTLKQSL